MKNFAVVGAGQMGTGIAIVANKSAGLNVKIVDTTEKALSSSRKFTESWCDKEIAKNRLTSDEKYALLSRFSYSIKLEDLHETDFVVEVIRIKKYCKGRVDEENEGIMRVIINIRKKRGIKQYYLK